MPKGRRFSGREGLHSAHVSFLTITQKDEEIWRDHQEDKDKVFHWYASLSRTENTTDTFNCITRCLLL